VEHRWSRAGDREEARGRRLEGGGWRRGASRKALAAVSGWVAREVGKGVCVCGGSLP
jgi:hypothetical protein